jgi:hypothetical protein
MPMLHGICTSKIVPTVVDVGLMKRAVPEFAVLSKIVKAAEPTAVNDDSAQSSRPYF